MREIFYAEGERIAPEHEKYVRVLIPQQMDLALFRDNLAHPDKRKVDVFAHGLFPKEDPEKQLILGSWLQRHMDAWSEHSPPAVEAFGFDVARSEDGDSTVLATGGQSGLNRLHRWQYCDIEYHVAEVLRITKDIYNIDLTKGRNPITVDMDGLGAGAGDRLRSLGVWVLEFRGNSRSEVDAQTYANLRCEAYATLARRLNPDDHWRQTPWAIPTDNRLNAELCAPEKVYSGDALRFAISPKRKPPGEEKPGRILSIQEKLGRSPDSADAVVYLFHAVRLLHNLNEWFAQNARPLVTYPSVESVQERREQQLRPTPPAPPDDDESVPAILRMLRREHAANANRPEGSPPPVPVAAEQPRRSWRDNFLSDD